MGSGWVPWVVALLVNPIRLNSSVTRDRDPPEEIEKNVSVEESEVGALPEISCRVRGVWLTQEGCHHPYSSASSSRRRPLNSEMKVHAQLNISDNYTSSLNLHVISSGEDFVIQAKADCYFTNGTETVRFVVRFIFNFEEYAHFDSDLGMFVALTKLGQPDVELWNNRPDILETSRASVDTLCRHNYKLGASFTVETKVQPEVMVYPERTPSLQHHNLLLCSVTNFYPGDITIRWYRNGQEERTGVISTGLIRNGDWTFQIVVMLEMTPELGDVYTCLVDHPSLWSPISVEWRAQPDYSWRKVLGGVGAFLFGLIFLLVGIIIHLRAWKGYRKTQ